MRSLVFAVLLLGGCATTPAGLQSTRVEATVSSSKSSADFATCVAEHLMGDAELRSSGDHYWVLRSVFGVPRHRRDFTPSDSGSVAELRSTGLARWEEQTSEIQSLMCISYDVFCVKKKKQ